MSKNNFTGPSPPRRRGRHEMRLQKWARACGIYPPAALPARKHLCQLCLQVHAQRVAQRSFHPGMHHSTPHTLPSGSKLRSTAQHYSSAVQMLAQDASCCCRTQAAASPRDTSVALIRCRCKCQVRHLPGRDGDVLLLLSQGASAQLLQGGRGIRNRPNVRRGV